jgi:hypothetical protein
MTMTIDQFSAALAAAFGDECTAIVLYGSAATAAPNEKGTDYNVLVVLRALRGDALLAAAAPVRQWQDLGHRAPLILTEAEWRSSRDVFAMEHADIAARQRVLHGALPSLPAVQPDDLRRQLEYEAMGALLHLRRGILAVGHDPLRTLDLLVAAKGTTVALLRSLLRVHGRPVPDDAAAALASAAPLAQLDAAPLAEVIAHARGERSIPPARAAEVLDGVHRLLKALVAHVDAMWHPDAPAVD